MSDRVLKWTLDGPECEVSDFVGMPLAVAVQDDGIVVWSLANESEAPRPQRFFCVNTGVEFDGSTRGYLGTATSSTGIVWHVFVEYA